MWLQQSKYKAVCNTGVLLSVLRLPAASADLPLSQWQMTHCTAYQMAFSMPEQDQHATNIQHGGAAVLPLTKRILLCNGKKMGALFAIPTSRTAGFCRSMPSCWRKRCLEGSF